MAAKRAFIGAVSIAVAAASVAHAQQIRPYQPAFDVDDYHLSLVLPDTGSHITGVATIKVTRTGPSDTLRLDLIDMHVSSVRVDGKAVPFGRTPERIAVPIPPKVKTNSPFSVRVAYDGSPKDGLIIRQDTAGRWTYFGDNWPNRARYWIPSIDHPSDKATVTWEVTAPASRTVVANGKRIGFDQKTSATGERIAHTVWRESQPIASYLMVIAAAPLVEYDVGQTACGLAAVQRCVPQSVYVAPEQRSFLPGPFARVGDIVSLFARLVGPFPYEKLAHLQSSTRFGGMENATAIFYADGGFRRRTMRDGVVAHETAHQWFGDAVTERDWPHVWLSEGFATYFAALWTRESRGDSAFRDDMANIRRTILRDTVAVTKRPVIDSIETNLLALLNRNSYEKGGFVLHMLRLQVGDSAFFGALREYQRKHRNSTATTDDLQFEMEKASGQKLQWFFDQWLRQPGYPTIESSWSYDEAAHQVVIQLGQDNRFGLGKYELPVTVAALDSSGSAHTASTRLQRGSGGTLRIPMGSRPTRIVLDPNVDLLAEFIDRR